MIRGIDHYHIASYGFADDLPSLDLSVVSTAEGDYVVIQEAGPCLSHPGVTQRGMSASAVRFADEAAAENAALEAIDAVRPGFADWYRSRGRRGS
jgi:hypothetical protein